MADEIMISADRYRELLASERHAKSEVNRLAATVGRVRMLCLRHQTEDDDGVLSDNGTLLPSQVVAAIDNESA